MISQEEEKAMFKIFSRLAEILWAEAEPADSAVWLRDPLSHPDIRTMDARALGDLPLGLFRMGAAPAEARCGSVSPDGHC
jgi:hypothetical protein